MLSCLNTAHKSDTSTKISKWKFLCLYIQKFILLGRDGLFVCTSIAIVIYIISVFILYSFLKSLARYYHKIYIYFFTVILVYF